MSISEFMAKWGVTTSPTIFECMRTDLLSVVTTARQEGYAACAAKVIADSERRVAELESMPGARGER